MEKKDPDRVVFLSGKRIYLGPIDKNDVSRFTYWMNDHDVTRFLSMYLPVSVAEEEKWVEELTSRKGKDVVLAIVVKNETAPDCHIGNIGLHGIDSKDRVATLGICIGNKNFWSEGYGTEAIKLLLGYAFKRLNLRKVCLSVFDFNKRAQACYKKCGFRKEGCLKRQRFMDGEYRDEILMTVFNKDWQQ